MRRTALKRGSLPSLGLAEPAAALVVVEDFVGHGDRRDVGRSASRDRYTRWLSARRRNGDSCREIDSLGSRPSFLQCGQHATACFADRRSLDEEVFPDVIGLLLLAHLPEAFVGQLPGRNNAIYFGDEIVVRHQFIDSPEKQAFRIRRVAGAGDGCSKSGRIQVSVHVAHRLREQRVTYSGMEFLASDGHSIGFHAPNSNDRRAALQCLRGMEGQVKLERRSATAVALHAATNRAGSEDRCGRCTARCGPSRFPRLTPAQSRIRLRWRRHAPRQRSESDRP